MQRLSIIGFGEAGAMFGGEATRHGVIPHVYDRLIGRPGDGAAKRREIVAVGGEVHATAAEALAGSDVILSLVTADQALIAAEDAARAIAPGALWLDGNSVAPETKRAAARAIATAGGRYVDVAVMSPVLPARGRVPLLLSGADAGEAGEQLAGIGFANVEIAGADVGRASLIKMIRSVMIKGIEALTAECVLAAEHGGVFEAVLASLDASPPPATWQARADYNLDRMMVHGLRRAAEMEEVVKTLDALGTGSVMARGAVARQRAIGQLGMDRPPSGLAAKVAALTRGIEARAA